MPNENENFEFTTPPTLFGYDGYADVEESDYVVDHSGRMVLRDDYEFHRDKEEILARQRNRDRFWGGVTVACGVIALVVYAAWSVGLI